MTEARKNEHSVSDSECIVTFTVDSQSIAAGYRFLFRREK